MSAATETPRLSRPALIRVLTAIQNSATFASQDILTFTGFMAGADEVADHVMVCFRRLPDADRRRVFGLLTSEAGTL